MNDRIEGVRLEGLPRHPNIRRVRKPKPFERPSTTVAAPVVKREWRTVPAEQISWGDTVPGVGIVTERVYRSAVFGTDIVTVYGGEDNTASWSADELVFAFTAATA